MVAYKAIVLRIDALFSTIKQLTNIDGRSKTPDSTMNSLLNREYQNFVFHHIKWQIKQIFDELTKLHAYVTEDYISSNLELIGRFMNDLMETWDVFFNGVSSLRLKRDNSWVEKQMEIYYKMAVRETKHCQGRMKIVKDRLRGKFMECELRSEEQAKRLYFESRFNFVLKPTGFDIGNTAENDEYDMEQGSALSVTEPRITDSSIDTSDDEDLLQEVANFCQNLENWLEEEEIRKEKEAAKRLRMLKRQAGEDANSPAKTLVSNGKLQKAIAGGNEQNETPKRNGRNSKREKKRKRKMEGEDTDTSDSDPLSDSDFSDPDNPEWQKLRERTNDFRNMRKKTYDTRQKKKDKNGETSTKKDRNGETPKQKKARKCLIKDSKKIKRRTSSSKVNKKKIK